MGPRCNKPERECSLSVSEWPIPCDGCPAWLAWLAQQQSENRAPATTGAIGAITPRMLRLQNEHLLAR